MRNKADKPDPDALIARIASRQYGVISSAQLSSTGLTRAGIHRRARASRLFPLHRGVYAVGHRNLGNEGRWIAAVLTYGDRAVLSHRSAAALWGIRRAPKGPIDLTIPGTSGRKSRAGIVLHRSTTLTAASCTRRLGIPVTSPNRTIADLRPVLSPAQLAAAIREAEFRGVIDRGPLVADPARSELEQRFLALCHRHRLPQPGVNVRVDRYVVDFLWPEQRLVAELDGWKSHSTRSAFEDDRARDARLSVLGYRVVRFTWWQVQGDPREVSRTIRSLLRS